MEILGIGPLELFFILIIALIVLGPNDMVKAGKTLGHWMRKLVTSPGWQAVQQTSRDIRYLPNKLMREAGIDDIKDQLPKTGDLRREIGLDGLEKDVNKWQEGISDWTTPPPAAPTAGAVVETSAPEESPASNVAATTTPGDVPAGTDVEPSPPAESPAGTDSETPPPAVEPSNGVDTEPTPPAAETPAGSNSETPSSAAQS